MQALISYDADYAASLVEAPNITGPEDGQSEYPPFPSVPGGLFQIKQGQRQLQLHGVVELLGVQAQQLLDLAQPVDQRIAMDV